MWSCWLVIARVIYIDFKSCNKYQQLPSVTVRPNVVQTILLQLNLIEHDNDGNYQNVGISVSIFVMVTG